MEKGTVKWFDDQKGYGFIQQDSGEDIFVHYSEVKSDLIQEGDKVEYEIGDGRKGPCAVNVQVQ